METRLMTWRASTKEPLTISIPEGLREQDLEVLVVFQPLAGKSAGEADQFDERGWPLHFFEETYGSLEEDPLVRLPQGDFEVR